MKFAMVGILCLAAPQLALGAGPLRHAVVLDERVTLEGSATPLPGGAVEAALGEALLAQGVTVIDAAQTRALRASIDPRAVVGGAGLGAITAQDADVIVAGVVSGAVTRPMGLNIFGCSLNAQLRVVAVDSGEVVFATSVQVMERDFVVEQALFAAAKKLARELAVQLAAKSAGGVDRRVELHVAIDQLVDVKMIDQLVRAVEGVEGVVSARVLHSSKDALNLEVRTKAEGTRQLALRLSEQPSSGLLVWGYSERVIRARLRLGRALGLRLVPIEFQRMGANQPDGAQSSDLLPRTLATNLAAEGMFEVELGTKLPSAGERAKLLSSLAKAGGEVVLLSGSVSGDAARRTVSASLTRVRDRKSIAEGSAECESGKLTDCMQALATRLGGSAALALQSQPASGSVRPVRVSHVSLTDVFPAAFVGRLRAETSPDWVEVHNGGAETIDDLQISASIPGVTSGTLPSERRSLRPNETAKIPLKLVMDPAKLVNHDRNEATVLQLELDYRVGEFTVRDHARRAVTVYHRNALTWSEAGSVAAFITATSDGIQRLARGAVLALPAERREDPLALSVALFEQLRTLAYVSDPVNPYAASTVDYVQYPLQTLTRGAGDCDDLAVLYAALLEAVGLPALLVTTPGHIFVAVPTQSPAHSLESGIADGARALMHHEGRLWIPVETSLVGQSFDAAWVKGAAQVAAATKTRKLGLTEVRRAWLTSPPVDLSPPSERGPSVPAPQLGPLEEARASAAGRLEGELLRTLADAEARLVKTPDNPELLNRKGVALVALGRLEEAHAVFTKSAKLGAASPSASNNLGNLTLLSGDAIGALHWYDEAAQKDAPNEAMRRFIVLNRLLAAWMHDAGGPRFLELVLGANDDDLKAFYQGVSGGPLRGATSGESKPAVRRDGDVTTTEGAPVPVARLVRWL